MMSSPFSEYKNWWVPMVEEIEIDKNKKKPPALKPQQQSKPQVYLAIHNRRVTNAGNESALSSEITMCFDNQLCNRAKGAILRNSTIIIHSIRIYAHYECAKEKNKRVSRKS